MRKTPVKWNIDLIKEYLQENYEGYKLITNNYISIRQKIDIQCPKGHHINISFVYFKEAKNKCRTCWKENLFLQKEKEAKEILQGFGYEFLGLVDIKHGKVKCTNNHEYVQQFSSMKRGSKCQKCFAKESGKLKALKIEDVRKEVESFNYKLLSNVYINNSTHLEMQCDKGHVYQTKYNNFVNGSRCPKCARKVPHSREDIKEFIESIGYTLDSEYVDTRTSIRVICDKGHSYSAKIGNMFLGTRCNKCYREAARGKNSPNWKGSTNLNKFIRAQIREWKTESLKSSDYKCEITGKTGKLHIHHKYPLHNIIDDVLEDIDIPLKDDLNMYAQEELDLIVQSIKEKHNEMLGAVMLPEIHREFHVLFGKNNNSEEQYNFFKENYNLLKSGELSPSDFKN